MPWNIDYLLELVIFLSQVKKGTSYDIGRIITSEQLSIMLNKFCDIQVSWHNIGVSIWAV